MDDVASIAYIYLMLTTSYDATLLKKRGFTIRWMMWRAWLASTRLYPHNGRRRDRTHDVGVRHQAPAPRAWQILLATS